MPGVLIILGFMAMVAMVGAQRQILIPPLAEESAQTFAASFRALAHASVAYAEANPAATGTIAPASLTPYLDPYVPPAQASAQITNGLLVVSAQPPGQAGTVQWVAHNLAATYGDVAYGYVAGGQMVSAAGGVLGAPPAGVTNGEAIYVIVRPTS